ncbi:hypothetical protein [Streptoalloteichus tenebrarius]|uniref:hypothetical protein n=1 Tax=Streptoalloteichus tenebrarius (strain ATCC 17920 / DSM 40477 / JCM 4838 / CBS 697.72 / NBRC 16177 / NCIMB 11028 / NRRL B-12390 / A12253. 1 / ISP 5477) TaxID=1933 RepID=UPI0020A4ADA6|nr:hypothetical protein [Streptoalloteichus tenebrarius]
MTTPDLPKEPDPREPDPTVAALDRIARDSASRFASRNLRIRRSRVVHAVRSYPWIGGLSLPGPACGQGWGGPGVTGELHPTTEQVTCEHQRCRDAAAPGAPAHRNQLALDLGV